MSTPPTFRPDDQAADAHLRAAFDFLGEPPAAVPPPPDRVWAGVAASLRPVASRWVRYGRPAVLGVMGVVIGLLLMRAWDGQPPLTPAPVASTSPTGVPATSPSELATRTRILATRTRILATRPSVPASASRILPARTRIPAAVQSVPATASRISPSPTRISAGPSSVPAPPTAPVATSPSVPAIPTVLLTLVDAETAVAALPSADSSADGRAHRRAALLRVRAELAALAQQTDSLLRPLGVLPETPPALPAPAVAGADSVPAAPFRRWSVALAFAPERNFFGLSSPAADTLSALRRTHEQGRAGYSATLGAEYRLTPRWSVGAGLGLTSYGAELRLTDRQTTVRVAYDTQTTSATQTTHVENVTYSIRIIDKPLLTPRFNLNYQIIGYDTVLVPTPDTVWTHVVTDGTVVTNTVKTTPTVTTRQETSARILRPNYRFLTLPLLVRYRLGTEGGTWRGPAANRWWADVALGAQVQLFLGGTQLTSPDARHWRTERVGPTGGPFRPLTVALTGALTLNYGLTPRLSASVAPTLRYQTESIYKASTGLTQRPAAGGVLLGVRYAF